MVYPCLWFCHYAFITVIITHLYIFVVLCEVNNVYTQQTRHHTHKDGAVENVNIYMISESRTVLSRTVFELLDCLRAKFLKVDGGKWTFMGVCVWDVWEYSSVKVK